ncbi:MAG: 4-(cytidine 5'-diphospho)-2-C-methyl-D-erythritol kinase [Gemmatimonadales bacterium]
MKLPGPDYEAPAKLNLFLHVLGRRDDGYHQLQTVFTLIDFADRLRFRVRDDGAIDRVSSMAGVPPEQDLAVRAALLLKEASGTPLGADIEIDKRIPAGGGLGGGSSDAATTLLVLDRLWETGFGPEALGELAGALGADVPYFLFGTPAWAEGVGDRLRPIDLDPRWYLVLVPPAVVPTGEVFAAPELTRDTEPLKMEDFSARPRSKTFVNDLEPVVTARYPVVSEHLDWLRRRAPARMTGSGACVFAEFDSRERAQAVAGELPAAMKGFVAQGLMQHPLRRQ